MLFYGFFWTYWVLPSLLGKERENLADLRKESTGLLSANLRVISLIWVFMGLNMVRFITSSGLAVCYLVYPVFMWFQRKKWEPNCLSTCNLVNVDLSNLYLVLPGFVELSIVLPSSSIVSP